MNFYSYKCKKISVKVNVSHFHGENGTDEYHLILCPSEYDNTQNQLKQLYDVYKEALKSFELDMGTIIFRRFFCSDLINQKAALETMPFSNPQNPDEPCAVSLICQPPISPAKVALWAYHIKDAKGKIEKQKTDDSLIIKRNNISHHWTVGMTCQNSNSAYDQTHKILEQYNYFLKKENLSLAENLIRTWFFVQNVDANYNGLVKARREYFAENGLTANTHFVASTAVEGTNADVSTKVTMDAYSISGILPGQLKLLKALDHLCPTYVYGVTFERGTSVAYQDRKHIFISGTASIDHKGQILHPSDMPAQLDRTIENVEVLLGHAGAGLDDMCHFLVYVRELSDLQTVDKQIRQRFGDAPVQVVLSKVCRPGWLVEIEGMAIVPESNPQLPEF